MLRENEGQPTEQQSQFTAEQLKKLNMLKDKERQYVIQHAQYLNSEDMQISPDNWATIILIKKAGQEVFDEANDEETVKRIDERVHKIMERFYTEKNKQKEI